MEEGRSSKKDADIRRWGVRVRPSEIELKDEQWPAVHRVAEQCAVPAAQVRRDAVDQAPYPETDQRRARATVAIGGFRSGRGDVSAHHDDDLAEVLRRVSAVVGTAFTFDDDFAGEGFRIVA